MTTVTPPGTTTSTTLRNALIATACIPLSIIAAFIVGEGLASLLGYSASDESMPLWAILAAGLPAIAVGLVAPVAAFVLGRRAYHTTGRKLALVPVFIGGTLAFYILLANALAPFA